MDVGFDVLQGRVTSERDPDGALVPGLAREPALIVIHEQVRV